MRQVRLCVPRSAFLLGADRFFRQSKAGFVGGVLSTLGMLLLLFLPVAQGGTCQPYAEKCTACRDCSRCGACNAGGKSCSVKRDTQDRKPVKPLPALPPGYWKK